MCVGKGASLSATDKGKKKYEFTQSYKIDAYKHDFNIVLVLLPYQVPAVNGFLMKLTIFYVIWSSKTLWCGVIATTVYNVYENSTSMIVIITVTTNVK